MKRTLRYRPTPALIVASIALLVALGGTGYAAITLPSNSVGPAQLKRGAVTPTKVAAATIKLFKGQRGAKGAKGAAGATGAQGAAGPQGTTGAQGAAGPAGAAGATGPAGPGIKWALVKGDGSAIIAQSGGISISSHFTGGYYLNFGSAVAGHAISASISDNGGFPPGSIAAAPCGGATAGPDAVTCVVAGTNDANHLFVTITDKTDTQVDKPFYVVVYQ